MLILSLLACGPDLRDPTIAAARISGVEAVMRPLAQRHVSFLRDQPGCHVWREARGSFADSHASTCLLVAGPTVPFDARAQADLAVAAGALRANGTPVLWAELTYDASGTTEGLSLALDAGAFTRLSYVWSRGAPPAGLGSEQIVEPIPGHPGWSVVLEDWN